MCIRDRDVRLPVTGDERDEVDRLRGTINRMAEGLEETEKMKNESISSVSHELRTPLTLSLIHILQRYPSGSGQSR